MGISAAEFVSTDPDRQTLDRRIRPTDEQFEDQRLRWNALAEHLLEDLKRQSGYEISSWLQGSYKFGTQIRPASKDHEFDIDLGVYFVWSGEPDDGSIDPQELKQMVQGSLESYANDTENEVRKVAVPAKAKCSRIHFDGNFHIDVPGYHLDRDRDARSLATASNGWENSDPKAIYLWFKNRFDENDRAVVRRLLRYFKMWSVLSLSEDKRPSSILLTVLVADAFEQVDQSDADGDDELFRQIASAIQKRLTEDPTVPNPINNEENLNKLSADNQDLFDGVLADLLSCADRALDAGTAVEAAEIWSEAFAHFFPIPTDGMLVEGHMAKAVATVAFVPEVSIRAIPKNSPHRVFTGLNGIGPIPRGCDIEFRLDNAGQVPFGSEVRWTVRNEGGEAEQTNDMGHRAGRGFTAKETSAYNGRHFMDVSVHFGGHLVGFRRLPVSIQGPPIPPRNRPRPSYVSLRGRR
jgi:hypothetical protein